MTDRVVVVLAAGIWLALGLSAFIGSAAAVAAFLTLCALYLGLFGGVRVVNRISARTGADS